MPVSMLHAAMTFSQHAMLARPCIMMGLVCVDVYVRSILLCKWHRLRPQSHSLLPSEPEEDCVDLKD